MQSQSNPTDDAERVVVSEEDRHDDAKLNYCQDRCADEHQHVSRARSSHNDKVSPTRRGKAERELLQSRGHAVI